MECKNGELGVWEISDISGGTEHHDGQLIWEIRLAIKRSHMELWCMGNQTGHQEVTHGVVVETTLKRVVENSVMS